MHARSLRLFPLLFLGAGCHVRPESLLPSSASAHAPLGSEYLRSRPAAFVVIGDAASFVWPALLQEALDADAGKRGVYAVLNGSVAAPGIGAWLERGRGRPFDTLVERVLEPGAARADGTLVPRTALCLVSLRGLGDERGPVKSANDMLGAEMGADALERLALELHRAGIERIAFATPLYSEEAETELGMEHVAVERLLARGHDFVVAGPDLFSASRRYYPDAYEDGTRPNEFGLKLVAEEWYRWLAGPDAREAVVEALYAKDFDVAAIEAAYGRERGLPNP